MLSSNSVLQRPEREFTYEDIYRRGQDAERLLRSPLFRDAVQDTEYDLLEAMLDEAADPERVYAARQAILGLGALERVLRAYVADGEEAKTVLQANGLLPTD